MKRLLILAGLCLAAVAVFSSSGSAQTTPQIVRGSPQIVTSTTTPRRDRTRPFTFTTTGRIIPPARYCNPGENPSSGVNCIPILCPPGVLDVRYCLRPGRSVICTGIVTVKFQRVTTTISSRSVGVRPDCTYRSRVTFRLRLPTRIGVFRVRARFQGNPVMLPKNAAVHTVRAG